MFVCFSHPVSWREHDARVVASAHAVPAGGVGFFVRAAGARSALRAAGVRSEGESQILAFQH